MEIPLVGPQPAGQEAENSAEGRPAKGTIPAIRKMKEGKIDIAGSARSLLVGKRIS